MMRDHLQEEAHLERLRQHVVGSDLGGARSRVFRSGHDHGGSAMRWRYTTVPVTSAGAACAFPVIAIAATSRSLVDE